MPGQVVPSRRPPMLLSIGYGSDGDPSRVLASLLVTYSRQARIAHFSSAARPLLHHVGAAAWRGGKIYDMETKMLLMHYLEHGESKGELARRLGLCRRTIHD
ncbi:MAG: hypothetical protein F4X12_16035 [Acidobacteriia bacterium]|nr:hypothetical protein [Terriglobia bacterium]